MTTPLTFSFLGPLVGEFLKRYPDVQVEMLCTDRSVALVEEGFDLAIRAGQLADSALIARRLGNLERIVVAAPSYLEAHGTPRTPRDLEKHDGLVFGPTVGGAVWALHSGGKSVDVQVRARMAVNEPDMLRALSLAGAGIAAGRLRRVLPEWSSTETPVHAVYPGTRHHVPRVMAFVDFLRERWPVHTPGPSPRGERPRKD